MKIYLTGRSYFWILGVTSIVTAVPIFLQYERECRWAETKE